MIDYDFTFDGKVLEPELDQLGFVHHHKIAEWLHNGRVAYLRSKGGAYETVLEQGFVPALVNLEMTFSGALKRDMEYRLQMALQRRGARYIFHTKILQQPSLTELATSKAELVFTKDGKVAKDDILAIKAS